MAVTYSFGYTNKTNNGQIPIPFNQMHMVDYYALREDEPCSCRVSNTTAPVDQPELVTYQAQNIKNVPTTIESPNMIKGGECIMYGVKIEELLRGRSDKDDTFVRDIPITANITFKHPVDAAITKDVINVVLARLLSALYEYDGDYSGTVVPTGNRINDLMRFALKPTVN